MLGTYLFRLIGGHSFPLTHKESNGVPLVENRVCVRYVYILWIVEWLCLLLEEVWSGVAWLDHGFTLCLGQARSLLHDLFLVCLERQLQLSLGKGQQRELQRTWSPLLQSHELVASLSSLSLTLFVRLAFDLVKLDKTLTLFCLFPSSV